MLNILWNKLAYCIKCTSLVWSIWQWQWRWRRWWWLYCCTEPWQTGSTLTTARAWPFEVSHFKDKYYNVLQSGLTYLRCCYCKSPRQSSEVVFCPNFRNVGLPGPPDFNTGCTWKRGPAFALGQRLVYRMTSLVISPRKFANEWPLGVGLNDCVKLEHEHVLGTLAHPSLLKRNGLFI